MVRHLILAVAASCAIVTSISAQTGKLGEVRQQVRAEETKTDEPKKDDKKDDKKKEKAKTTAESSCREESWFDGSFLVLGVVQIAGLPFTVPHELLHDDVHVEGYFPRYPYEADGAGMFIDTYFAHQESWPDRWWMSQWSLEGGDDGRGLSRGAGRILIDTTSRFGLESDWNCFRECCCDQLWIGDVNLTLRFAQSERMQMRTGLGARFLIDSVGTDVGFNFMYGGDFFPCKPFVISTYLDAGTLGSAGVFHARSTAGAIYRHWELYAGYDYFLIGSTDLQGPLMGIRLWF